MKISTYHSYDDLPLFLNAELVAKTLGISISSAYELMHEASFPTLRVGNRIVVPKEKFVEWVMRSTKGGDDR
ncbi:helix-turn-helix domain-containing protein [Dysosmobacter sp.]|uniref:helix-turn-helix domain-containing protein n=1 Tax=Dysosmobacter sp. TaxID=2591382 RepID=UPI003A8F777E